MKMEHFDGDYLELHRRNGIAPRDIQEYVGTSLEELFYEFDHIPYLADATIGKKIIFIPRSFYLIVPPGLLKLRDYGEKAKDRWALDTAGRQLVTTVLDVPIELTPYFHLVPDDHVPYTKGMES